MAVARTSMPYDTAQLVVHVVGARPNFVKMAPLVEALRQRGVKDHRHHTGQHYRPQDVGRDPRRPRLPLPRLLARGSDHTENRPARS